MNIRFKNIDIQNFRSIDRAKITLCDQGTVIVKGVNEYEDKATSNGSGKSSIFEAIIYALYEETSSGEKDVENRIINDGFRVNLEFEINNDVYTVSRQGKQGKSSVILLKNGVDISARNKTDTNKLIVNLLGINKQIFLDSIFLSQNAVTNLASLPPTSRKERLEILSNTDESVSMFKDKIKSKQLEYEANCVEHKQNISSCDGNVYALTGQIQDINLKIQQAELELEKRKALGNIDDIDMQIKEIENNINDLLLSNESIDKNVSDEQSKIDNFNSSCERINSNRQQLEETRNMKKQEYLQISSNIDKTNQSIQFCNNNKSKIAAEIETIKNSDKCPTCGRKYDNSNEEHISQLIQEKLLEITNEDNKIFEFNKQIKVLDESLSVIESQGLDIKKQIEELDVIINDNKLKLSEMENTKQSLLNSKDANNAQILQYQSNIKQLQDKKVAILKYEVPNVDDLNNMISDINTKINNINATKQQEENLLQQSDDMVNVAKHSVNLITKEFRTYLLQNSISYLNKLLLSYSSKLFSNLEDVVRIEDNDNKLDIKLGSATYESLSGGEKTRVNIALLLAQKSLASMVGNISCNLIILDEILGYCDSEAESNVIALIIEELDSLESIYMISHKEIPIPYDSELVVVKNKQGLSSIKCG